MSDPDKIDAFDSIVNVLAIIGLIILMLLVIAGGVNLLVAIKPDITKSTAPEVHP